MKRLLVLLVVLSFLLLLVPAYGIANAKSPKPQDQVKNFMNAAAGLKASKAAGYWVAEESSNVTSQLAGVPSGTKISLSKLKLVVTSQTADTAEVTATYTIKVKPTGKGKPQQSNLTDTFNLKLVNGIWLISGTTMWGHLTGLVTQSAAQPTATATTTSAPTPTTSSAGPVKIGCIMAWSGPMATAGVLADQIIALVADQVKNQGGILGGREVKFIKGDDAGTVAGSQSQAKKMVLEDKVTILTLGGESAAAFTAVSDVAEENKVPYVCIASLYGLAERKYTVALYGHEYTIGAVDSFLKDVVKPKTVAYLGHEGEDSRQNLDGLEGIAGLRSRWKNEGIDLVYEQYFPDSTMDFSPYITKIKYVKPDIVVCVPNDTSQAITINKQVAELGGWGNIKYYVTNGAGAAVAAIKQPGAIGTYVNVVWLPGSSDPGMKAFEDAYVQKYKREPSSDYTYHYNGLWTAIKAIEFAGTDDPDKVAQGMRSGKFGWESAWGQLLFGTNGMSDARPTIAQVQEGSKLLRVWPQ